MSHTLHQHAERLVQMTEAFLETDSSLSTSWSHVEHAVDSLDQGLVAATAAVLGVLLVARGFALMKPTFVLGTALALGGRTLSVAWHEGQAIPGVISACVVFACGVVFAHRMYPVFVFACGAAMAGSLTFLGRRGLGLMDSPAALIGLTMLVSVFGGLCLQHVRILSWRALTPLLGGMLVAATLRFLIIDLFTAGGVTWLSFTHFSLSPAYVVTDPLEVVFVVSWGVCSCVGWYSQVISIVAGVDPLALPEHMSHKLQRLNKWFPWVFDGGEEFAAEVFPSLRQEREPFLPKDNMEASMVDEKPDYRPECLILMMVLSVLLLNFLLMSKPLLFLGHVVMMSVAFQVFMTAALSSYISPTRVLFGLKSTPVLRHFTHGSLNLLVLFFAVGGYLSLYARNVEAHQSQFGHGGVMRIVHVWTGYVTLAALFIMFFSGTVKMFAGLTTGSSVDVAKFHDHLGKTLYGLVAVTQICGYFIHGLLPLWASLLLTTMLVVGMASTLFLLIKQDPNLVSRMKRFGDGLNEPVGDLPVLMNKYQALPKISTSCSSNTTRLESLRSLANSSHRSAAAGAGLGSHPPSGRSSASEWEPMLNALDAKEDKALLSWIFVNWHRHVQSSKINKAQAELQGSNNLVDFLSSALVQPGKAAEP
ncbi:PDZ domain-containing protein [Durusdinium trenchii]|uniref:PDZ domain-containing protein n=1 Tax=Durusdinium trenchii TaxID=1381693 RepID=A0ABP0N920_9DINO